MKNILFLSFYFRPDLCAGSFRNSPLLDELARQAERAGAAIDVYTTHPQRYSSFVREAPEIEEWANVRVRRIRIPHHKSGFVDQIHGFSTFYRHVLASTRGTAYDLVYASSSRLFTAYLGRRVAARSRAPLYLDIRDIFVDTIREVVRNPVVKAVALPVLGRVEASVFGGADHINLISAGFRPYFERFSRATFSEFTNGIDDVFIEAARRPLPPRGPRRRIVYAGNLGEGQGLHKVVPQAAATLGADYEFRIIGDGGAKRALEHAIAEHRADNVALLPPVGRDELVEEYLAADYLLIHLNDYEAFTKVLPSKIFELGVFPARLLAGVGGYAREFMKAKLPDALLFDPGDHLEMARLVSRDLASRVPVDRSAFIEEFRREQINARMAASILALLE